MGLFYAATGFTTLLASLIVGLAWDRAGASTAFGIGAAFAILALLTLPMMRGRAMFSASPEPLGRNREERPGS
jgi:dipeptide/tripeptide permease